jgi:ketosteroid isomerase-like protein
MIRSLAPAALLLLFYIPLSAHDKPQPAELAIQQALATFIRAFDNLDWESFRLAFDDNATVFYPRGFPNRATGRDAFEEKFKVVFQQIRDGKTQPPFMDIQPKDPQIQRFGDVAIVTFHLDDRAGFLNRRTIVLHKTTSGWKIVHLHASEVATANGQR